MRRVYDPNSGKDQGNNKGGKAKAGSRERIESDALSILRKTREMIDPDLLETMRETIAKTLPEEEVDNVIDLPPAFTIRDPDIEPIDRQKNLSIVMKYIQANPDNKAVMQELQSMLAEDF